uniref:Uncharacterized protein n=1 Tax=Panagrolaimus superbus TaxID=310955 RepID=A0A914Z2U8_9BILA
MDRRLFAVINEHYYEGDKFLLHDSNDSKHVAGQGPERMVTDFEDSVTNAENEVWPPHVQTSLYLLHLAQNVMRRMQNAKLSRYYHDNERFRIDIRRISALAALPPDLGERAFRLLRD